MESSTAEVVTAGVTVTEFHNGRQKLTGDICRLRPYTVYGHRPQFSLSLFVIMLRLHAVNTTSTEILMVDFNKGLSIRKGSDAEVTLRPLQLNLVFY